MKPELTRIGKRIRQLRKARGMTQGVAARKAGLMASTWSRIETGKNKPKVRTLRAMADALGVTAIPQPLMDTIPAALTNEDCVIIAGHWSGDWP